MSFEETLREKCVDICGFEPEYRVTVRPIKDGRAWCRVELVLPKAINMLPSGYGRATTTVFSKEKCRNTAARILLNRVERVY